MKLLLLLLPADAHVRVHAWRESAGHIAVKPSVTSPPPAPYEHDQRCKTRRAWTCCRALVGVAPVCRGKLVIPTTQPLQVSAFPLHPVRII